MKSASRVVLAIVCLCFLLSGLAGLVYQMVWTRYLALFLGHTSYAVVAVLASFMGGLALGNAWLGARADRSARPLEFYAWLEVGIGVYAIVFPSYYALCHEGFVGLARRLQPGSDLGLALKFAFSLATILAPTVMMGATFPVLTKFVTRSLAELRTQVAALYAINSGGAVGGCFVADFWLIPAIGLEATVYTAAGINLVVGLVAFLVSRWIEEGKAAAPSASQDASAAEERYSPADLRLAIIGIGVSGFVAMLYEVAWTRVLALALGSSTHAYSLMVATFITGITIGALVIYRWRQLRSSLVAFAWAELALAGAILASMFFYELLPYWFVRLAALLARRNETYPLYELTQMTVCFLVMLVPTVCLGMTLPLASRIATDALARTGRSVGRVFAVNTLGTVLGASLTGLWLLPAFGLARTFAIGVALNFAIGFFLLGWRRPALRRGFALATPVLAVGLVALAHATFAERWQYALTAGLWRSGGPPSSLRAFRQEVRENKIVYYRDGAGSTVNVVSWTNAGTAHFGLKVNGKVDAGTGGDVPTQLLTGHLPFLLKPEAQTALVVGLGSGMTCGAVSLHPTIQRVDVVEISPEVVAAARYFSNWNGGVLDKPQVRVVVEDAKSFLQIARQQYDVIISEPSNPWMAGVSGVFSQEYYESCRAHLAPGGLMVQWAQLYETSDAAVDMVLATFSSVFPFLSVWHGAPTDLILVGSTEPRSVDLARLQERFEHPAVRADLARFGVTRLPQLLSMQWTSQQNGAFLAEPDARVHSDYFPVLEYLAQRAFFARPGVTRHLFFDEKYSARPTLLLAEYLREHPLTEEDYRAFGRWFFDHHLIDRRLVRSLLQRWLTEQPQNTIALEMLVQLTDPSDPAELEIRRLEPYRDTLLQHARHGDPTLLRIYAKYLMQWHRMRRSVFYLPESAELERVLSQLIELDPDNRRVYRLYLAEIAWDRGQDEACLRLGQSAFDPDVNRAGPMTFREAPRAPHFVLTRMIETLVRAGKLHEAWDLCQQARQQRYVGEPAAERDPILEMTYRKVAALVGQPLAPMAP